MLDSASLEVIARFKESVLTRKATNVIPYSSEYANRDGKAITDPSSISCNGNGLTPKVVEYNGSSRLVFTNENIEKHNLRMKRKWVETFGNGSTGVNSNGKKSNNQMNSEDQASKLMNKDIIENNLEDPDSGSESVSEDEDSNPFQSLNISEILAPLVHPSEIVSHPAISKTYESPIFSQLASDLIHLIEIEQGNLNSLNKLLQVLNGEDWYYLLEDNMGLPKYDHGLNQFDEKQDINDQKQKESDHSKSRTDIEQEQLNGEEKETREQQGEGEGEGEGEELEMEKEKVQNDTSVASESNGLKQEQPVRRITRTSQLENDDIVSDPFFGIPETLKMYEKYQLQNLEEKDNDEFSAIQEDLVNYLQVSIQRQQEYIKNLTQIRNGLVRSDRLKQDLHKWGKEMYDKKSS